MGRFDERRTGDRPVTGGPFGREDATSELVAALRRRERELATLAANTPDPIARYDRDLRLRYVNPATVREAGRPREAIVGRTLEEAFPELAPALVPQLRRVLAGEGVIEVEFEFLGPGGARTWHSRVVPELDDAGAVVGILAVSRDVTARRRVEEALRASEQRFRALVENGTDFIAILDEQGTIRYASPSHERLLGLPPEALVGRLPFALVHPDDVEPMKELLAAAMRGPTAQRT
ncbi:MAG TPA: PAS domain-containing protein, partial [Anaeromyxobacteraceae bacterium]|nr:PAS domain-containing protein [Anaeromyxobacteraceae bacterium]